jgi:hypothetical protein
MHACLHRYLYIKTRADQEAYPEFQTGLNEALEKQMYAAVEKSLTYYEKQCFESFFPRGKAREISVVVRYPVLLLITIAFAFVVLTFDILYYMLLVVLQHYPRKAKGIKNIGIDAHIDDTIFRTAMLHLAGGDKTDNIWVEDHGEMRLIELEPGDLVIFSRLSHLVKPIQRKSARRVCTFFF